MKKQILLTMFTLLSGAPLAAEGFMEAINNGEFNAIGTWVNAIHSKNPTALSELTTLQNKINAPSSQSMKGVNNNKPFTLTPTHVMGILNQLEQGPTSWHTVAQAQTYYNAAFADSSTFEYWPNDSAKVTCYDSCGNGHRRRYASNEWPFSWEHSALITDCDGTIIDGSQGCSLNNIGCPLRAHLYTSYIFDYNNPSHAVLKVDYLKNPQEFPAVTALLLLLSNSNAPYLASFATGYLPGVDSQGKSSANTTCKFWPANGGEETTIASTYCQFNSADSSLTCQSSVENGGCAMETAAATLWLACPLTLSIKTGPVDPITNQAVGTFYCPSK